MNFNQSHLLKPSVFLELDQLIRECQQKERRAQKSLYKILAPKLFGVCFKYCKEKALAEDLFQEAIITIFNKIDQYKFKGSFEGWARRITVNTILSYYRKHQFFEELDENQNIIHDDVSDTNAQFTLNELLEMIHHLSPKYRIVFSMYVLDDYSHQEIAKSLGISVGTSKSNLSRARVLLQNEILKRQKILNRG